MHSDQLLLKGRAWAHWLDKTDEASVGKPISHDELVRRTGIDFMPGSVNQRSALRGITPK